MVKTLPVLTRMPDVSVRTPAEAEPKVLSRAIVTVLFGEAFVLLIVRLTGPLDDGNSVAFAVCVPVVPLYWSLEVVALYVTVPPVRFPLETVNPFSNAVPVRATPAELFTRTLRFPVTALASVKLCADVPLNSNEVVNTAAPDVRMPLPD